MLEDDQINCINFGWRYFFSSGLCKYQYCNTVDDKRQYAQSENYDEDKWPINHVWNNRLMHLVFQELFENSMLCPSTNRFDPAVVEHYCTNDERNDTKNHHSNGDSLIAKLLIEPA
jgi:hypothetical protein